MADAPFTPDELRRLARLVEENGLSELRYEQGDLRVTIRTAAFRPSTPAAVPVVAAVPSTTLAADALDAIAEDAGHSDDADQTAAPTAAVAENLLRVEAPIMGVFYRKPGPDEPNFVEVGDLVEPGAVIGVIEAMKVFSEVPSEVGGRVVEIPARQGALVQPGEALVILEAV